MAARPIGATDEYIWWGDKTGDPILPGGSVNLSFTTAPDYHLERHRPRFRGFANTLYGTIAVPEVPDPHEVRTKSDQGIMNDGRVSLREAVTYTLNHQDKGTDVWFGVASPITLDPNQGQIELGKGGNTTEINIGGPMTIQRDSSSPVNHRIFKILPNTTVKLSSLDLRNGKVTDAEALFSRKAI